MEGRTLGIGIVVLLLCACTAQAALYWDVYDDVIIDEVGDYYARIDIFDRGSDQTVASMIGGRVDQLGVHESSVLDMSAGSISSLLAEETSTVNVLGDAEIGGLGASESATVNISGGNLQSVRTWGDSMLAVSGGSVAGVHVRHSTVMNMSGGEIDYLDVADTATVNLSGGSISQILAPSSGNICDGVVNVYGYGLEKISDGGAYGFGQVSGFWASRTAFKIDLNGGGTYSRIHLIPEPTTVILLALGGLAVKTHRA